MRITMLLATGGLTVLLSGHVVAQVDNTPNAAPVQAKQLPLTAQLKKTVVFIKTHCVHDFTTDVQTLKAQLPQMQPSQKIAILQQLVMLTNKLTGVKVSMTKLSKDDAAKLTQPVQLNTNDPAAVDAEIVWIADELVKMTTLSEVEVSTTTPAEQQLLPVQEFSGTGFFIAVPNDPKTYADGKSFIGTTYLVTNRHVAQPGAEHGRLLTCLDASLILTHRADASHTSSYAETNRIDKLLKWELPDDKSVDLAVAPIGAPQSEYDYVVIPITQFVTDDDIDKKVVVEGDPVMFSGLFVQLNAFQDSDTLEPIVRSGSLAMIPDGTVKTTMNDQQGHLYFAEAHAFGGNSGSPMFVDIAKFAGMIGSNYRFLGVLSGEVFENADMTLSVTTTLSGQVAANSDISLIVPAFELMKVLDQPALKKPRDASRPPQPAQTPSATASPAKL